MGSATPRVESFFRAHTGELELATLPERVSGRPLPPIEVVDLRDELQAGNTNALSLTLDRALQECHADGGQSILFLNRRGTSTVVLCRTCGEALTCTNCSVSLVHHVDRSSCDCHYCGLSIPLPSACPSCGSRTIRALGMGTERLEREVRERFPALRLIRMDRDTTRSRDAYFDIYDKFRRHEADCLIGTQMVAKGWDLGNVRLVGIVNADTSLHFPDYRSGELTFSLLTQVAGRAGRGDEPARVVLQTYSPGHYAVRHATTHDYLGFARDEIRVRKALRFPPYARLCVCTFVHKEDHEAEIEVRREAQRLSGTLGIDAGLDVLGPTPAFLHRLRGEYRWQIHGAGQRHREGIPSPSQSPGLEHRRRPRGVNGDNSVAVLPIVLVSDHNDVLTTKAIRVPRVDDEIRRLMDDMVETDVRRQRRRPRRTPGRRVAARHRASRRQPDLPARQPRDGAHRRRPDRIRGMPVGPRVGRRGDAGGNALSPKG